MALTTRLTAMATITIPQDQLLSLITTVATLAERVKTLADQVEKQEVEIKNLVALANRGKGSVWILMGVGGAAGALLANVKAFIPLFFR